MVDDGFQVARGTGADIAIMPLLGLVSEMIAQGLGPGTASENPCTKWFR